MGRISILCATIAALALGGCLENAQRRVDEAKRRFESTVRLKWFVIAIRDYHASKKKFPDSLEELRPLFGPKEGSRTLQDMHEIVVTKLQAGFDDLFRNPVTESTPGYEYVKPTDPKPDTLVIYQLKNGQRQTDLTAAYWEGSVKKVE